MGKRVPNPSKALDRREFLAAASAAAVTFNVVPSYVLGGAGRVPPSEKINVAGIGVGGQGEGDIAQFGGENVIAVRVDASDFEGWWYEGGGIYRHAWLTKTDLLHVAPWGVFVATPKVKIAGGSFRRGSMKNSIARGAKWKTGSSSRRWICRPTG